MHLVPDRATHLTATGEGMSPDKTQWGEQFQGNLTPPKLSKTDEHFSSLGLEFVETREGIVLTELNDLFERVSEQRLPQFPQTLASAATLHNHHTRSLCLVP